MLNRIQQDRIVDYLKQALNHVEELGCTCADRSNRTGRNGHRSHCTGIDLTRAARTYLTKLKRKGTI